MQVLLFVVVAILGILAGGIVNVLADDLPKRRKVQWPPRYPDGEVRPPLAWLGLTAFLFGKRSSSSGAKLSWRYPVTELLTAGLMLLALQSGLMHNESTAKIIFWLIFMVIFALITVIDIEHKLILFAVINPSVVVALIYVVISQDGTPPTIVDHVVGGIAGYVSFFLLYNGGFLFTYLMGKMRGQEIDEVALGFGDVMLAGLSGLILAWQYLILALIITIVLGAVGALLYLVLRQLLSGKYVAFMAIPYGPYIIIGTISMLLFGAEISRALFPTVQ